MNSSRIVLSLELCCRYTAPSHTSAAHWQTFLSLLLKNSRRRRLAESVSIEDLEYMLIEPVNSSKNKPSNTVPNRGDRTLIAAPQQTHN